MTTRFLKQVDSTEGKTTVLLKQIISVENKLDGFSEGNFIYVDSLMTENRYPSWVVENKICIPRYLKYIVRDNPFNTGEFHLEASFYTQYKEIKRRINNSIEVEKLIWDFHIPKSLAWDRKDVEKWNENIESILIFCSYPPSKDKYLSELDFKEQFVSFQFDNLDELKSKIPGFKWNPLHYETS